MTDHNRIVYVNDSTGDKIAIASGCVSKNDISVPNSTRYYQFDGTTSRVMINRHLEGQTNRMINGCKFNTVIDVPTPSYNEAKVEVEQPIFSCIRPDGSRRMEVGLIPVITGDNTYKKVVYVSYRNNDDFAVYKAGQTALSSKLALSVDWSVTNGYVKILLNGKLELTVPYEDAAYQPWEYEDDEVTLKSGEVTYIGANPIRQTFFFGKMWSFVEQSYMSHDRSAEMIRFLALKFPEPFYVYPAFVTANPMTYLSFENRALTAVNGDVGGTEPVTAVVDFTPTAFPSAKCEFTFNANTLSSGYGVCRAGFTDDGLYSPSGFVPYTIYLSASTGAVWVNDAVATSLLIQTGRPIATGQAVGVVTVVNPSGTVTDIIFTRDSVEVARVSGADIPSPLRAGIKVATTFIGGKVTVNSGETNFADGTSTDSIKLRRPGVSERESMLFDGEGIQKMYFPFLSSPGLDEFNNDDHTPDGVVGITTGQAPFSTSSGKVATFAGNTFDVPWVPEGALTPTGYAPAAQVMSFCLKPTDDDLTGSVPILSVKDKVGVEVWGCYLESGELVVKVEGTSYTVTTGMVPLSSAEYFTVAAHLEKYGSGAGAYRVGIWVDGTRHIQEEITYAARHPAVGAGSVVTVGGLQGSLSTLMLARKEGGGPLYRGGDLDGDWRFLRIQNATINGDIGGELTGTMQSVLTPLSGTPYSVFVASNGDVYVAGAVTIPGLTGPVGPLPADDPNKIAKFNASLGQWEKIVTPNAINDGVGYGIQGFAVQDIAVTSTGIMYVAGWLGGNSSSLIVGARINLNDNTGGFLKHSDGGSLRGKGFGVLIEPNGVNALIVGDFRYTSAAGKKYNYIVRAKPTTNTVERLPANGLVSASSSAKGVVLKCAVYDNGGNLYVGGSRTFLADDPTTTDSQAMVWKLDAAASNWVPFKCSLGFSSTLGTNIASGSLDIAEVSCLAVIDNLLFAGGSFNTTYKGIAYYDLATTATSWSSIPTGVDVGFAPDTDDSSYNHPRVLSFCPLVDGSLAIGGNFMPHASQPDGAGLMRYIPADGSYTAAWGSVNYVGVLSYRVRKLSRCPDYTTDPGLYLVGDFDEIGAVTGLGKLAKYAP